MTNLVVTACGPMTSLQDGGRVGYQRLGISNSGAMDRLSLAAANALVGNGAGAGAIEFVLLGGSFSVEGGTARVAVAGAPCAVTVDGQLVPMMTTLILRPGQSLDIGSARAGVYIYLAVAGGFDVAPQLGSLSLHPRAGIGGIEGRPLRPGDRIPLHSAEAPDGPLLGLPPVPVVTDEPIRVVLGPQDDHFTETGVATFLSATYTVSQEADRMGYRLAGPQIEHSRGYNIVSDGIVWGSVQVPGSGEPIVMMADRQTTGGYPKIATVISADLRLVAQRRPGQSIRFQAVAVGEAQHVARERAKEVANLQSRARPLHMLPPVEELLTLNLAGAAVDALASDAQS